jgi:hypothetical protein
MLVAATRVTPVGFLEISDVHKRTKLNRMRLTSGVALIKMVSYRMRCNRMRKQATKGKHHE